MKKAKSWSSLSRYHHCWWFCYPDDGYKNMALLYYTIQVYMSSTRLRYTAVMSILHSWDVRICSITLLLQLIFYKCGPWFEYSSTCMPSAFIARSDYTRFWHTTITCFDPPNGSLKWWTLSSGSSHALPKMSSSESPVRIRLWITIFDIIRLRLHGGLNCLRGAQLSFRMMLVTKCCRTTKQLCLDHHMLTLHETVKGLDGPLILIMSHVNVLTVYLHSSSSKPKSLWMPSMRNFEIHALPQLPL